MEITDAQYRHLESCLPTPRGHVTLDHLHGLNAIVYVAEQGGTWRGLPQRFGHGHTIYTLYAHESVVETRGAGSRLCTVAAHADPPREDRSRGFGQHPRQGPSRRHGGVTKHGPHAIGQSRGGWTTTIHLVVADARTALTFALSPGQAHDAPEGRKLLQRVGRMPRPVHLLMDRAYEGDATRQLAVE
jgi:transposase